MAQELQPWTPSTALSPERKWDRAVAMVRYSTSRQQAAEQAKRLIGCYPHARPPDPAAYAGALTDVLEQYPLGVVERCCDPRTGIVRTREFPPTVACIVDWCDRYTAAYVAVAQRRRPVPEPVYSEEHCATMREKLRSFFAEFKAGLIRPAPESTAKPSVSDDELRAHYATQKERPADIAVNTWAGVE